jgi:RimJ/RimL family protein N-acetyltransferase
MKLTTPFPLVFLDRAWSWMQERPAANFDDDGPKNFPELVAQFKRGAQHGERSWCVETPDGQPCGYVAFLPINGRLGTFHGICFAQGKTTRTERREAMKQIIEDIFAQGIEKICAGFFSDNSKIRTFLRNLDFQEEGYFFRHTVRGGRPIDMVQMARFREGC